MIISEPAESAKRGQICIVLLYIISVKQTLDLDKHRSVPQLNTCQTFNMFERFCGVSPFMSSN